MPLNVHHAIRALSLAFALSALSAVADVVPPQKHSVDPDWPVCAEPSVAFGYLGDPQTGETVFHPGLDFKSENELDVRASAPGRVTVAQQRGHYGLMIELDHGGGALTRYGALETALVKPGDHVSGGQIIARVGPTGPSTDPRLRSPVKLHEPARPAGVTSGPHLHFELWVFNVVRNPLNFLCPRTGCSKTQTQRDARVYRSWPEWPIALACH